MFDLWFLYNYNTGAEIEQCMMNQTSFIATFEILYFVADNYLGLKWWMIDVLILD